MNIVIISHNQKQYIEEFRNVLQEFFQNSPRIFVFDRCKEGAKEAERLGENFILNTFGSGFMAGYCRDLGLKTLGNDDTMFLDGDRIPVGLTEDLTKKALELYDITLLRSQYEIRSGLFRRDEFAVNHLFKRYSYNCVYSCGMVLRKEIIIKVKELQNDRLFHQTFDGAFGEEDTFLGSVIYYLGGTCGLFPNSIFVKGSFRSKQKIDVESFNKQMDKRRKLLNSYFCTIK